MFGTSLEITPLRPDHDSQGRTLGTTTSMTPIQVRLQPLRVEDEIAREGQSKLSVLTAPFDADIAERDLFSVLGRTWRVQTVQRITGLGAYTRVFATSEKQ